MQLSPAISRVLFNLMLTLYSFNLLSSVLLLGVSCASTRPLNAPQQEFFKADTRQLALRLSQSAQLRAELASLGRSDVLGTNVEDYGSSVEPKQEFVTNDDSEDYESVAPTKKKDYNYMDYYLGEELGAKIAPDVDFESRLTHCQLVNRRGFSCEEHYATTADGYILGLFRIGPLESRDGHRGPQTVQNVQNIQMQEKMQTQRPVVLLMHGLFDCSFTWINNFRQQSLAYVLVDAGFDVWLGNVRGNFYSRNHTTLNPDEKAFWWWTLDEMARHDLNATTLYILQHTGQLQLSYVGHSQGTAIMFAALASYADIAARVRFFGALAPVARVGNLQGTVRLVSPDNWLAVLKGLEVATTGELFPVSDAETEFERKTCAKDDEVATVCLKVLYFL